MGGPQWFWFLWNESVMYRAIGERRMREVWVVPDPDPDPVLVLRVSVVVVGECCGSQWWRLKG